jgi:hypothetical protein
MMKVRDVAELRSLIKDQLNRSKKEIITNLVDESVKIIKAKTNEELFVTYSKDGFHIAAKKTESAIEAFKDASEFLSKGN